MPWVPAEGRCGGEAAGQFEHRRRGVRQPALHRRTEVLHVRHRDHGGLLLPIEVAAVADERVVDDVDHDTVLDLILHRGEQLGGEPGVGRRVARPGRGAGEGMGPHDVAASFDEQLRACADEPLERVAVARTEAGAQPLQHAADVEWAVDLHDHVAGDHRLVEPTVAHGVARRGDRREVHLDGDAGTDAVARRVGWCPRRDREHRVEVDRFQALAVDDRDPAFTAVALADHDARDDEIGGAAGQEREYAEGYRSRTGDADRVVGGDGGERVVDLVERQARGDTDAGHPDAVAHEERGTAGGEVVEIDLAFEGSGDGPPRSPRPGSGSLAAAWSGLVVRHRPHPILAVSGRAWRPASP